MSTNLANISIFLVQTFVGLYFMMIVMRFLMQISRVDYYNPICQAIIKITDPIVRPLKRALPTVRGVDSATLLAALIVQLAAIALIMLITGNPTFHPTYIAWALLGIFSTIIDIYFYALIIMVIASWIAPNSNHPVLGLIYQLTEPVCAPMRKLLPPMGGLDFSIILVFVAITMIDRYLVVEPLIRTLGIPRGLIMGS